MSESIFRYRLPKSADVIELEATIMLAFMATESLHGESQVRLELRHAFDPTARTCVVDASGDVGRDFNRLLLGFISREFGKESFRVDAVDDMIPASPAV